MSELTLPEGIVLGLSWVPDFTDSENLQLAFAQGELSESEFLAFCAAHDLLCDAGSNESAACFLSHKYGQPVAWVHLPASPDGLAFGQRVLQWAHQRGFCLVEPEGQYCILKGASLDWLFPQDA
jgi:hypothetical protein